MQEIPYRAEDIIAKFRDAMLDYEIFYTLKQAEILIEHGRNLYDTIRAHGSLHCQPPAPEAEC